ncbi:hypothetical protein RHGRI_022965 [Rhododendron griersonianum]|uniref:Uncharacterized protein n=1 Tax=Rhododendron griersonianum TaxID=479676 RepID=A0AAV6J457_9ERIC|nr:hypothetical protein RHGRI_022965 [Rhododendron griersonianum]
MEKKKEDDHHLHAVWFAAGSTLVVAACLQRAAVVSLVEQWRVWVFLALNLLLLAILFTSTSAKVSAIHEENSSQVQDNSTNYEMGKGRKQCRRRLLAADDYGSDSGRFSMVPKSGGGNSSAAAKSTADQLSKEELNERVEAFIAMFRQQLVSDR